MSMIEIHNSPPTPPRTAHSSSKPFDPSPMSSYRYPPATTEVQGSVVPAHYPPAHYSYSSEQYRSQPPVPPVSSAQLNLPPLRSIDVRQPQAYSPSGSTAPSYGTSPVGGNYTAIPSQTPPMAAGPQYYPGQMAHLAGPYDPTSYNPQLPMMRYPLPMGEGSRSMQHSRNKKEVKRRTKTGCLTCRKRRIKCDEGQPTCRNCAKSKRECAGYDPMFKPQSNPSPAHPVSSVSGSSSTSAGHGFVTTGYPLYAQGQSATASSPTSPFDRPKSAPFVTYPQPEVPTASERGAHPSAPIGKTRRFTLSELLALGGQEPPPLPPRQVIRPQDRDKLFAHWFNPYSRGLDRLLETMWYSRPQTASLLFGENRDIMYGTVLDANLSQKAEELEWEFLSLLNTTADRLRWTDPGAHSQEARLLWRLLESCRDYRNSPSAMGGHWKEDPAMVANRVDVLESLLTGEQLHGNPLPPASRYATPEMPNLSLEAQLQERELAFWYHLGRFVAGSQPNETLGFMRSVLDNCENRDILYSIAVCRHYGNTTTSMPESENDRVAYFMARDFIGSEIERSSNEVFSRFCAIASRIRAD